MDREAYGPGARGLQRGETGPPRRDWAEEETAKEKEEKKAGYLICVRGREYRKPCAGQAWASGALPGRKNVRVNGLRREGGERRVLNRLPLLCLRTERHP